MEHVDSLILARWIVPIEPIGRVLHDHALAIRAGRIVAVTAAAEARERFSAQQLIERREHVLLPGLVNAHTHAAMTLLRGAAESASIDHWLNRQIRPLQERWVDAEYVRDGTRLAIADMLTSGTTCFGDLHLFPESAAQAAAAAGIRACIGLPILDHPSAWAGSADEYFDKSLRLHDDYRDDPLITTAFAPYAPSAVTDTTLQRVQRTADELELPVIMQINETRSLPAEESAERALVRLQRLGLLSPLLAAVHMVHLDLADLELAATAGINVVHCPQANLKLGCGVCPVTTLLKNEIRVALGTAGAASNNDLSLLDEMRTAALLSRGLYPQAHAVSAHEWLRMATLNGARALGLEEAIGSLVPGKWADLCCIDLNRAHTQPVHDVAAQVVFAASRDQVSDVWVAGRALLSEHRLTRMDLPEVLQRAASWQLRMGSGQ